MGLDLGQHVRRLGKNCASKKECVTPLYFPQAATREFRDDIVNEEVFLNFIGGYEETVPL